MVDPTARKYRFDVFVVDTRTRTVSREGGAALAMTPRVFDTLVYLVEHQGAVVGKDELLRAVWPDRVVEDNNLSQSISALRRALDEEGDGKRFILTVPGRGYRFTAEVCELDSGAPVPAAPEAPNVPEAEAPQRRRLASPRLGSAATLAIAGAMLAVVVAVLLGYRLSRQRGVGQGEANLIVVAPFNNLTAGGEFDTVLDKALEIDLGQSPNLSLMAPAQLRETLRQMARSPDERLSADLAREVCRRNEGKAVLSGTVSALGSSYLLTLEADDCTSGRRLAQEKTEATSKEAIVPALDDLVGRMRHELGESPASIARYGVPLAKATTASFEALKVYSEGVDLSGHGRRAESIPLFQRAIELDPNFAMAYADLAGAYYSLNQGQPEVAAISKAYELRNTVSEREMFFIVASYHRSVTKDLNEQVRNLELWSQSYPLDAQALVNLCNAENFLGRYPLAVEAGRRELALNPHNEAAYVVLARALRHADRFDEARAVDEAAIAKGLAGEAVHGDLLQIAVARNDAVAVAREVAWSEQKPSELMFQLRAEIAFSEGRLQRGRDLFEQLIELARRHGLQDYTAAARARLLVDLGLDQEAKALLERMPPSTSPSDYLFTVAEVGDPALAEAILQRDLAEGPSDTLLMDVLAPEVRAALAMRKGKPDAAVAALHSTLPYDLRNFDVPYLRGTAYLAASDGVNAAAEFRKILEHPGVEPVSPHFALSRLGLARALVLQGKGSEARGEYQAFLAAWKNADTELPQLRQARSEYARVAPGADKP